MGTADDTIFAVSSGGLPAGVALVRISGPAVRFVLETIVGNTPHPRHLCLSTFRDASGKALDRGLVAFMPAPASFTGEDTAEFHLHGGHAVVAAVLSTLEALSGLRHAEAGEFTRRAFLNGKVDLAQAEALADLVAAETETQRRLALDGSQKATEVYAGWRERLLHARAMIEAELDFADEGDIPGSISATIWENMRLLAQEIDTHLLGYRRAKMIREGYNVVIVGAPNAGKSSLLNTLAQRDVAIVSEIAGTTRDIIDVTLDLGGYKVVVSDTAGLRETGDRIETLGVERARARAREADLILMVEDMSGRASEIPGPHEDWEDVPLLRVGTKSDLTLSREAGFEHNVSALTGQGIDALLATIVQMIERNVGGGNQALPSQMRHVGLLRACKSRIEEAFGHQQIALDLSAECLRLASIELGRIAGRVDPEEIYDAIFSRFCVGK